jgi:type III restriction enzyme
MHSSRAVEQILGRILRLPRAAWKKHDELNLAYAFAASPNFAQTAMALTDALIQNGFKRQEASDFIVPASSQQLEFPEGDLFSHSITVSIPEIPNVNALPDTIRQVVSFDPNSHTMTVIGEMTEMIKEQLGEYFSTSKGKEAIETAFWEFRKRAGKETERQRRIFSVPVLAIKVENLFEQLEENHLLERPLSLSKCDALLTEEEFPSKRPEGKMGEITVSKEGNLEVRFLSELTEQMWFFGASEGWTEGMLVQWLDRAIPHHDISQAESALFLVRATRALIDQRGFSLNQLVIDKYRLRHAVNEKIEKLRHEARGKAFQDLLFSEESSPLCVKPDVCFPYDPLHYPYGRAYRGGCQWRKHYYDQVGELEAQGEEFECAQFLDQLPQINSWVRNLERRPKTSFWLQTSTDKFYPDFVCLLNDGRYLAVEYKGEHLWSTDDSKEKRIIGDLWEKLSNGKCLFIMPKGKDFAAIREKIDKKMAT